MTPAIGLELSASNWITVPHLSLSGLQSDPRRGYSYGVPAKSGISLGGLVNKRRNSASSTCERFFSVHTLRYGGCARDTSGYAGLIRLSQSANLCTVAPIRYLAVSGDGSKNGALPMRNSTQSASIVRRYIYRVVHPASNTSTIVTAQTPTQALLVFGQWFSVPTSQLAINRRSPAQEVRP